MNARQALKLLLALLVSAGLAFAPLAAAVAAEHPMPAGMLSMAHASDISDMAADMPCCPDKQKSSTCEDCPLVAICVLKMLQAVPSFGAVALMQVAHERLHPLDDVIADGLARPPPDHPPRSLV